MRNKREPGAKFPKEVEPPASLTGVLGQSQHVREMVKESAEELASVNTVLKQNLADLEPHSGVENALRKNEAVENRVLEASEQLSDVTRALEVEVRDRHLLDHQFAAVVEQGQAATHASFHDALTGLPNRTLFNDRLEHGLAQAKRHDWSLAVMFMDLDKFKEINDTHGHVAGDCVLQAVAQRLRVNTRGDDTVSRLGGDEFLYLLMEIGNNKDIATIAEKLLHAIQQPIRADVGGVSINLSVKASIGISVYPKDGNTVDTLMISADLAMYRAKKSRTRYAFAR